MMNSKRDGRDRTGRNGTKTIDDRSLIETGTLRRQREIDIACFSPFFSFLAYLCRACVSVYTAHFSHVAHDRLVRTSALIVGWGKTLKTASDYSDRPKTGTGAAVIVCSLLQIKIPRMIQLSFGRAVRAGEIPNSFAKFRA